MLFVYFDGRLRRTHQTEYRCCRQAKHKKERNILLMMHTLSLFGDDAHPVLCGYYVTVCINVQRRQYVVYPPLSSNVLCFIFAFSLSAQSVF